MVICEVQCHREPLRSFFAEVRQLTEPSRSARWPAELAIGREAASPSITITGFEEMVVPGEQIEKLEPIFDCETALGHVLPRAFARHLTSI